MQVKQIVNLFSLMELFARTKQPLSARDIVEAFSWPRSSAFNIIATLVEQGYLHQPSSRGGYYPTSKWMDLAREFAEPQARPLAVREMLVELMHRTGETMILAGAQGISTVFLDVAETEAHVRYSADVGQRLPIHVTAAGRAILAQYADEERAALLRRIKYERYEKGAPMSASAVLREITKGAKRGFHVNLANYAYGVAGIAVPFPFRDHRHAIVLGAPVSRVEGRVDDLGAMLQSAVDQFAKKYR